MKIKKCQNMQKTKKVYRSVPNAGGEFNKIDAKLKQISITKSLVREMTYSNILSINAVYIFQRDPNLNSRFHNTSIKVKAQT